MIVISDTTPIIALLKVNRLDLLKILFEKVVVPEAVYKELTQNSKYPDEKNSIENSEFIVMKEVKNRDSVRILRMVSGLDAGESEALMLYEENEADLLLIDEHKGRSVAKKMSVDCLGTLGVFMLAYDKKILTTNEVVESVEGLLKQKIRLSNSLCIKVFEYVGYRK